MSLRDLPRHIESDDIREDDPGAPIDDGLAEWPVSDLDYLVYYDPDHEPALDFAAIERDLLAEIAPRHRVVRFERLRAATLRTWSPFSTRTVEENFLRLGFGRGPVAGSTDLLGPAVLRRRQDYLTHHQARAESLVAMRCLAHVGRSVITSVKTLVLLAERPRWLHRPVGEILTPVCGQASRAMGDDLDAPVRPLTSRDGLLLACDAFTVRRTVHPAVSTTPDTVDRMGRRDLRGWCGLDHEAVRAQVQYELGAADRCFGRPFDPSAAALWMAQLVMELRIALTEIERALKANDPTSGGSATVAENEDVELQVRLIEQYGPVHLRALPKKRLRHHVRFAAPAKRDSEEYREPVVRPAPSPLRRRLLTAFYGGMSLPYDPFFAQEYAAVEDLARWIGELRRTGHATMDRRIAWDLRDIVDKNLLALDRMLDEPDAAGAEALLVELLPVAGWEALIEAADQITAGERETFAISYHLLQPGDVGPDGGIDGAAGSVTIRGTFLMLPLRAADRWRDRAWHIPPRGLYIDDRRDDRR